MSTRGEKRKKPYKKMRKMSVTLPPAKPETKKAFALHTTMLFDSVGTAWRDFDILGPITAGAGVNQRIGRRIQVKSFRFRGSLFGGAVGTGLTDDFYGVFRIMIFTTNMAPPATTPTTSSGYVINTPLNKIYMRSLQKVLYDQYIPLTNAPWADHSCSPANRQIEFYHKFKKPLIVDYVGDTASNNSTQLWISCVSDSTLVPHPGMSVGYAEVCYYDY